MKNEIALSRSFLYSPASRTDRVRKALEKGDADVVVADLEDGTAPGDRPEARKTLADLLARPPKSRSRFAVRINALATAEADRDLATIERKPPQALVVPKVESSESLVELRRWMRKRDHGFPIYAQIETAKGLLHGEEIAAAEGVEALIFGSEDYAANVGALRTPEGLEILYARSHVIACAAAHGIEAIDQIWPDFKDGRGLANDAAFGARLGYAGKQLIHPDQIPITHKAFAPQEAEVARAREVVQAADAAGGGVVVVQGRMIDRPLVEQARRVLRRAAAPR